MEAKAQEAESRMSRAQTKEDALNNAILAVELYMKATRLASSEPEKARLRAKCDQLLSRAEEIKQVAQWPPKENPKTSLKAPVSERTITRHEEIILLEGSKLHGFIFPQWKSDPDEFVFEELANGSTLYTEPSDLKLSDAQQSIFTGWKRPSETFAKATNGQIEATTSNEDLMIATNSLDLVQDIITDCSVVASLCAVTSRAAKGHGKILSSQIFPYDKSKGRPRISKNGKYIFRFNFNGAFRKVIIDDRLPASNTNRSLHVIDRNNPQLLWPALVEKAYLKVRGGYDFPGSNSGTDLWVLTGWIPEQVFLENDDLKFETLWKRIFKAFGYGDVMITLGTGKLSHKEERELGLVGEHDYAVLDLKEVGTQKQLLVKNPWCDGMIWKGSQGALPEIWVGGLQEALPTNPETTPGSFWMSFEDVAQHFESLYLNWNPGLFRHRQDHHFSWTISNNQSPGSFTNNPQYLLKSKVKGTVWILLSRHFATAEHNIIKNTSDTISTASNALGFISLYVFKAGGHRVYLSDDALHRGAYVDSPQTLVCLELTPSTPYTIVIAQHGIPLSKCSFTLSFFSLTSLPPVLPATPTHTHFSTHTSSWTLRTCGGNASSPTYPLNPQFSISIPSSTPLLLVLETDQEELAVHVKIVWSSGKRVTTITAKDIVTDSGDYRRGCALASTTAIQPGNYTIVCSTFEAGQTGHFTLRVGSNVPCIVKPIMAETAGRLSLRLPPLVFTNEDRILAPISVSRLTNLRVVARCTTAGAAAGRFAGQSQSRSRPMLKVSIERGQGPNKVLLDVSTEGEFSDAPMGIRTRDLDLSPEMGRLGGGVWLVVERLGGRRGVDEVEVEILSDGSVEVGAWGTGDG